MNNQQSSTLVLQTADLALNSTNSVGTADQYNTNWVWNNINLRTLLGDMYEKYDRFALVPIRVHSANTGAATAFGATESDRVLTINIAGLPFTNNTYDTALKTISNHATFQTLHINNTANTNSTVNGGSILTFTKNQELLNLNIYYKRLVKNVSNNYDIVNGANAFPDAVFIFNIYGVDKKDRVEDLNSSRMF